MLISVQVGKNKLESAQESTGFCSNVVALFLVTKYLTKTDRCAGALS
jgi:hypothetical protein